MKIKIAYEYDASIGFHYYAKAFSEQGDCLLVRGGDSFDDAKQRLIEELRQKVGILIPQAEEVTL